MPVKEITLRLPDDMYEALVQMKEETGIAVADLVIMAVLSQMNKTTSTASMPDTDSTLQDCLP